MKERERKEERKKERIEIENVVYPCWALFHSYSFHTVINISHELSFRLLVRNFAQIGQLSVAALD